jgi:hypothetical protein
VQSTPTLCICRLVAGSEITTANVDLQLLGRENGAVVKNGGASTELPEFELRLVCC